MIKSFFFGFECFVSSWRSLLSWNRIISNENWDEIVFRVYRDSMTRRGKILKRRKWRKCLWGKVRYNLWNLIFFWSATYQKFHYHFIIYSEWVCSRSYLSFITNSSLFLLSIEWAQKREMLGWEVSALPSPNIICETNMNLINSRTFFLEWILLPRYLAIFSSSREYEFSLYAVFGGEDETLRLRWKALTCSHTKIGSRFVKIQSSWYNLLARLIVCYKKAHYRGWLALRTKRVQDDNKTLCVHLSFV